MNDTEMPPVVSDENIPSSNIRPDRAPRRRIYLATSWRNQQYPAVLTALRDAGHDVYDFRNPAAGNHGISWFQIDPDWQRWTPQAYARLVTTHPVAHGGFAPDKAALDWCDTLVLLLPCGRSAHLEAGYAAGQGKSVFVLLQPDEFSPELMYLLCSVLVCSLDDLLRWLDQFWPMTPYLPRDDQEDAA